MHSAKLAVVLYLTTLLEIEADFDSEAATVFCVVEPLFANRVEKSVLCHLCGVANAGIEC